MKKTLAVVLSCACAYLVSALPPPHPDVLAVRLEESQLPSHLRSQALHNPHLREVLPLSSQLHPGEKLVYNREAHDVSRKEVYNILTHAGLIPRKHPYTRGDLKQPAILKPGSLDVYNPPFLQTQDLLQYL